MVVVGAIVVVVGAVVVVIVVVVVVVGAIVVVVVVVGAMVVVVVVVGAMVVVVVVVGAMVVVVVVVVVGVVVVVEVLDAGVVVDIVALVAIDTGVVDDGGGGMVPTLPLGTPITLENGVKTSTNGFIGRANTGPFGSDVSSWKMKSFCFFKLIKRIIKYYWMQTETLT